VQSLPDAVEQTELNERGLFVTEGLDAQLADQLVDASKQPHIREYCPNDAASRFASLDKVTAWQAKGRLSLPLVRKLGDGTLSLAGFGWMGPGKPGPDEPEIVGAATTFAIRLYKEAAGQGNALPYTKAIVQANQALYGDTGVWLEAWSDNVPALRTYEKMGFQRVAEQADMRHGSPCTRIYMTLGNLAIGR